MVREEILRKEIIQVGEQKQLYHKIGYIVFFEAFKYIH